MDLPLLAFQIALAALAPFVAAVLLGLDRIVTARMQNRVGPPVLQVLYDFFKLVGKRPFLMNRPQVLFAIAYALFTSFAFILLVFGSDLVIIFFTAAAGSVFLALGAYAVRSPYSQMGANRELLQMAAYEPVFLLALLVIGIEAGSFNVSEIVVREGALIFTIPLIFVALVAVLVIKLQKSPYDIATAHQEIVSGPYVEYSGPYLAITKFGHWYELALLLGVVTLLYSHESLLLSVTGKLLLIVIAMMMVQVLDNVTARLTKDRMLRFTAGFGIAIIAVNVVAVYVLRGAGVI